jgi:PAS domain-containing protein
MLPLYQWLVSGPQGTAGSSVDAEAAPLPSDWLFNASNEPVLIVNAANTNIVQANPPAAALLGQICSELAGTQFLAAFEKTNTAEIRRCLALAQSAGSASSAVLRTQNGGSDVRAQLSLVRSACESYMLVRLDRDVLRAGGRGRSPAFEAIDRASAGFLLTEHGFHIDYANRAFAAMAGVRSPAEVRGSSLLEWLQLTEEDLSGLRAHQSQRAAATLLTTELCPAGRRPRRVEICAIPVPDGVNQCWGFTVRDLPRLN